MASCKSLRALNGGNIYQFSILVNIDHIIKFRIKALLLTLLIFTGICARAQQPRPADNKVQVLVTSLDSFRVKNPTEKVHIHFDKPYYAVGDTIWMKAYVVDGSNWLSQASRILHVDLVNDNNAVKTTLTLPLQQGLGWGSIALSDSLVAAGNYHIRAYTNWMRNFGPEYFFDKSISIGSALAPKALAQANRSTDVSIQFFPEGGELVNGLSSKVSFKAVGTDGLSREVSGYVLDKNNTRVTTFRSEHAGMGTFTLQPVAGNSYTAVIKPANGTEKRVILPKVAQQGYILAVTQDADNIAVNITVSEGLLNSGNILLVAQANNIVQYAAKKALTRTGFSTTIPKSRFPEGVVQLTLFSAAYQPVAERLVFIHHTDQHLKVKLTSDKTDYKQREKVHLNVQVTDQQGTPVMGSFSLAITDEGKVPNAEVNEKTIFSNLLLSSDLKGYIEQPNYYFTDNNADKTRQLDNLLLTQGWRKFEWKNVLANNFPALSYPAETGMDITGQVLTSRGKPAAGAKVFVLINMGNGILIDTVANAEGRFKFDDLVFGKNVPYNVTAQDAKGSKNVTVKMDKREYEPATLKRLPDELPANSQFATYLENSRKQNEELMKYGLLDNNIVLQEVNIKDVAVKNSASMAGPGNADQVLTFMDLLGCQYDLSKCLQGRLTSVRFQMDTTNTSFSKMGASMVPYSRGFDKPMTIIVDGIERPDGLSYIVSSDVSSVEVLRGGGAASLYGLRGGNGVIIVTTKRGDINYTAYEMDRSGSAKSKTLTTYKFQGYDLRRRFYSPDYDNPATNREMADLRTTIYWNPNVITDETGKASIEFFNADGTGSYRVITEGLDITGKLGREVYKYNVR